MRIWLYFCLIFLNIMMIAVWGARSYYMKPQITQRRMRFSMNLDSPHLGKLKKRKAAIVCCFVGSKYYGLQMDKTSPLETIEYHISKALNKVGCVIGSNQNDLSKIGWSRSSRTDKGVHAARVVLSGKLEIDEVNWLKADNSMPELARRLNEELPEDIKVLSVLKMNQGFRAREAGHWREYEYLMPTSVLTRSIEVQDSPLGHHNSLPKSSEEAILRLNAALKQMEGSLSFHNFHKLSPKALRESQRGHEKARIAALEVASAPPALGAEMGLGLRLEPESGLEGKDKKEKKKKKKREAEEGGGQERNPFFFDPWIERDRGVQEKTRTVIYRCRADPLPALVDGEEMVRIHFTGQSFLLHQIRLMMGCSILIARGTMPTMALELALTAPKHILFPMAPAEGLVLVNAGFNRNCNGQSLALDPAAAPEVHRVLLNNAEWGESETFKQEMIYPQVKQDWAKEDKELERSFLLHCHRYHVPAELWKGKWTRILREYQELNKVERLAKEAREATRVFKNVHDFRNHMLLADGAFSRSEKIEDWLQNHEGQGNRRIAGKPFKIKAMPHKALLPNTLATSLAIHYGVIPGSVVLTEALRGIATYIVANPGECEYMNSDQLFSFVVKRGDEFNGDGLNYWQQQCKHSLIE